MPKSLHKPSQSSTVRLASFVQSAEGAARLSACNLEAQALEKGDRRTDRKGEEDLHGQPGDSVS